MDLPMNFKFIGNHDVSNFISKLSDLDWQYYTERQEVRYGMQDTLTVPLVWDERLSKVHAWPALEQFTTEVGEISKIFESIFGKGEVYTCVLTNLPAHCAINFHRDIGKFFKDTNRVHIPIQTNSQVEFVVGDEKINMKVGEMWEINNSEKKHGVFNNGNTDRIHLMIDWKPFK